MQKTSLIINADDLGMSQKVNDAIFNLMNEGLVSSATIMSNGKAFEDAVKRTKEYKDKSFGIHLNITEFSPLTNLEMFHEYGMIEHNEFNGFIPHLWRQNILKEAIYIELESQVLKLLNSGVNVSHIDSHHHIHTQPHLFFIIKKLQSKFGLNKARLTMNYYNKLYHPSLIKKTLKKFWNSAFSKYKRTTTTDYFSCVDHFFKENPDRNTSNKVIELMCHPGSDLYKNEIDLLVKNKKNIADDFQLISYNNL